LEGALKIRVYYLPEIDTLDIWVDDPSLEVESTAISDNVILRYSGGKRVIGVEVLSLKKLCREELELVPPKIREVIVGVLSRFKSIDIV